MKKIISIILSVSIFFVLSSCGFAAENTSADFTMTMQIDNPVMTVNGTQQEIDPGRGTAPVIVNDRTLVPIRAIIEAMGGTVEWNGDTQTASLTYGGDEIRLTIDSMTAYLNDKANTLDTASTIINERTMLPIRFIAESFKFNVDWSENERLITITKAADEPVETPAPTAAPADKDSRNNVLIAYFSRAGENWEVGYVDKGNTAVIADYISEKVDADVFEITPVDPYPESYNETLTRVQNERDNDERPEFNGEIENFDQYDTVFLGYPIWYGGLPMIMYTFLEKYDMSGKTVIPFSTHGGSGWGSTKSELNTLCPDAEFIDGFSTAGTNARSAQDEVNSWLDGLDLNLNNTENKEGNNMAELLYQGHASFRLTTGEGKVIYIDPYAGEGYDKEADLILVTHQHPDHNKIDLVPQSDDCVIFQNSDAITDDGYKTLDFTGVHIEPVQAYNQNHDVKQWCVGYLVTVNGKTLYFAGDTSKTDQMAELNDKNIEYAFLPIDGHFNMDIPEAVECAELIGAKHTVPIHMSPGELFDRERAEQFVTPSALIVEAGEVIEL